jgi:hypothetical protein
MRDVEIATVLAKFWYQAPSCAGTELEVGPGIIVDDNRGRDLVRSSEAVRERRGQPYKLL